MTTENTDCISAGPVLLADCQNISETLQHNLRYVMSEAPTMLETLVWLFQESGESSVLLLTQEMARVDPLGVYDEELYLYWMKQILHALTFGMPHDVPWSGIMPVAARYAVRRSGDGVDRFTIYEQRELKDCLLHRARVAVCLVDDSIGEAKRGRIRVELGAWTR